MLGQEPTLQRAQVHSLLGSQTRQQDPEIQVMSENNPTVGRREIENLQVRSAWLNNR